MKIEFRVDRIDFSNIRKQADFMPNPDPTYREASARFWKREIEGMFSPLTYEEFISREYLK